MADIVRIRRARRDDLNDLLNLLQLLVSIEEDFDFDAERQRRGLGMLLDLDSAVILAAERENRVIGMCTGQCMVSTAEGGFSLLIEDVVVDESWQGQGIGTQLLQGLEKWASKKKVFRFQLLADRSNRLGLLFYEKQNWKATQLVCLRKKPVKHNENEG